MWSNRHLCRMTHFMHPIIIHISNDFPDILVPDKTKAIERLVDGTPDFRHIVYSLNRVTGWKGISSTPFGADRLAIAYKALPKGLFWEARLKEVANFIIADMTAKNIVPDIIQGHKFTVEGLVAQQIAHHFKKPFVLSIQGDTDTKILHMKRSLRKRFQVIANEAALIFPFAVWPIAEFKKYLTLDDRKLSVLPVVPGIDALSPAPLVSEPRILTVFHLNSWNRKNIVGMLNGIKIARQAIPDIQLDVYGGGSAKSTQIVQKFIQDYGLEDNVTLKGPTPNGELPNIMKNYVGFILPSKRESYGLVYVEALFSGIPVIFSKNRAIDGIFETKKIGYACDPFDEQDIATGMKYLIEHQTELKKTIAEMQVNGDLDIVRPASILKTYKDGLQKVLSARA